MKKKLLSLLLVVAMVGTMVLGCAKKEVVAEKASTETKKASSENLVGISVPKAITGWTAAVQYYAEKAAKEEGLNYISVAAESSSQQANDIDDLIQKGCKVIVMLPLNDELSVVAQKVMDAGITLIDFDRTLGNTKPNYLVNGDNKGMGVNGAKYIGEKLGGKGKVAILNIPSYGEIFTTRVNGFKDTIAAEYPDIEIVGEYASENGSPEAGLAAMTDVLTANPNIDAIYSTDDELSVGIYQAIQEADRKDIKVVTGGGGANSYFKLMEKSDVWLCSQTYAPNMIIECVKMAKGVLEGKTYDSVVTIPTENVDKKNVEQWKKDNLVDDNAPY
ncbi:MAG: substrate-binding domain-containing protein [Lachnospiraceae bacterium]|nr:substrate-binding domain-containing protein [Lachnospiraceae bacterium]